MPGWRKSSIARPERLAIARPADRRDVQVGESVDLVLGLLAHRGERSEVLRPVLRGDVKSLVLFDHAIRPRPLVRAVSMSSTAPLSTISLRELATWSALDFDWLRESCGPFRLRTKP